MGLTHIVDMSVVARLNRSAVTNVVQSMIDGRRLGMTGVLHLEALYGARDLAEAKRWDEWLRSSLPLVPTHQADWERASEVLLLLVASGKRKSAGVADLVQAAVAERAGLTVLHYDGDFEHIASVTGQPVEAVAPLGSL